jgi:hypothetical protein
MHYHRMTPALYSVIIKLFIVLVYTGPVTDLSPHLLKPLKPGRI